MIAKVPIGVDFFDERYGGAYRGRSILVTGRGGSGKSVVSLQFLAEGLKRGERGLLLSVRPAADVVLYAHALGLSLAEAVESGHLIVLEYSDYVPGRSEASLTIPPEGFIQLAEIVESNGVQRLALDTCLPWVVVRTDDRLAEHVFSFVRSFDRLGTTTLLTLPKPVSPLSFRLKRVLEDTVPIAVMLHLDPDGRRFWIVTKYLGETRLDDGVEYVVERGVGIRRAPQEPSTRPAQSLGESLSGGSIGAEGDEPATGGSGAEGAGGRAQGSGRVRLADAILPSTSTASRSAPEGSPAATLGASGDVAKAGGQKFRWGSTVPW